MIFYNKDKKKGINWFELLCFGIIVYKVGNFIFNIGSWIGYLVNKG